MDWLERLEAAGFRRVGSWTLSESALICNLTSHASLADVLYAFVADGQVVYVGKTTKQLGQRMYQYQHPGPTQRTNIDNHARLRHSLGAGRGVDIYALVDAPQLEHAGFRISLAAGLEDSIIAAVRPPWNKIGH